MKIILKSLIFMPLLATAVLAVVLHSVEEYRAKWPRFSGPDGGGVSAPGDYPTACDLHTGANVAWSAPVPAAGFSSPVVWGNRVFLSGSNEIKWEVMCFDAESGQL